MPKYEAATTMTREDVRLIFRAWEKARLVYNGIILGFLSFAVLIRLACGGIEFVEIVPAVGFFLGANIFYFAAPGTAVYLRWLGWHSRWADLGLFMAVLLLGPAFTLVTMFWWLEIIDTWWF
jgi:hypothetical protein